MFLILLRYLFLPAGRVQMAHGRFSANGFERIVKCPLDSLFDRLVEYEG